MIAAAAKLLPSIISQESWFDPAKPSTSKLVPCCCDDDFINALGRGGFEPVTHFTRRPDGKHCTLTSDAQKNLLGKMKSAFKEWAKGRGLKFLTFKDWSPNCNPRPAPAPWPAADRVRTALMAPAGMRMR